MGRATGCPTTYPTYMTKTSVYLSDEDVERLALLAQREGTSQAEVIRRAINQYRPQGRGDRHFTVAASGQGSGRSIADVPEEEQLAGFGS